MSKRACSLARRAASHTVAIASTPWLAASVADAQAQDAAEGRAQSFQAVQGALKEDVPGGPLLVYAYGLIWLLMLLYVIRLARLQQHNQREIERLSQVLAKAPQ